MRAAFPNAQGRLLAIVRVRRDGERFLIETEAATREKVYSNLFRFTFAGDFFVEDLSDQYDFFSVSGAYDSGAAAIFITGGLCGVFLPKGETPTGALEIDAETFERLRIERGVPIYGVDCDESTIVPELGTDGLISYNKGCYIGQEIIARIHFRGHVAKQLRGLRFDRRVEPGAELRSADGKPAGRVTSVATSSKFGEIALGFVRYEYLEPGTRLESGEANCEVAELPMSSE
jgi:folate-binding protein YgfZ